MDDDDLHGPGARVSRRRTTSINYIEDSDDDKSQSDASETATRPSVGGKSTNGTTRAAYPVKLRIGRHAARLVTVSERTEANGHEANGHEANGHEANGVHHKSSGIDDGSSDSDVPVARRSLRSAKPLQPGDEEDYEELSSDQKDSSGSDASLSESHDDGFVVEDSDFDGAPKRKKKRRPTRPPRPSRSRGRPRTRRASNDEDDFGGSSEYSDAPRQRKKSRRNGDDDDDEDAAAEDSDVDEVAELQDELRELRESASPPIPVRKVQLRERKEVNYQILPPPMPEDESMFDTVPVTSAPRRGRANAGPIRRLFPTTGPFGGNDVVSVFGSRGIPGLGSIPGLMGPNPSLQPVDSDSSDDDGGVGKVGAGGSSAAAGKGATGVPNMGIVKPKKAGPSDSDPLGVDMNIDFSSVGGLDNYINQLKEMVSLPLNYPEVYQQFGITPPRGVLFHGPPGTGKTLMARALAASCSTEGKKITFFMRKGADCLSKWVGEAERQLRILFEEARNQQPSIIFFDEIDGLAPVRSSKQEQIHASIVSTLLALMDGMDNRGQVIVIGATNRPDSVDPALRRPGRFDREFYFPLPDLDARKTIISIHTKKWDPPLKPVFVDHVAELTKGYGGADLRALCTEAALNAIQRKYPQIYLSKEKLLVNPADIHVTPVDFMKSIDKIVPSSARSTSSGAAPLPDFIKPLLDSTFERVKTKLDHLLPRTKKLTALEEALYEDPFSTEGGFARQEAIKGFQTARVFRPRLLICGEPGMGQQYIGAAVLHHLEGFHIQSFDLGTLMSDSARTPEATMIQLMVEARRHTPSVVFIPNIETWFYTISESARSTFRGILRNINPTEQILVLGLADASSEDFDPQLRDLFGYSSEAYELLSLPPGESGVEALKSFFSKMRAYISSKPTDYPDQTNRKKRVLEELPVAPALPDRVPTKSELRQLEKKDMQLKNLLKVRLSGLMDLFKNRYKRFKKPVIDDMLLVHLFEPQPEGMNIQHAYVKSPDDDMILEVATGKKYYNIDLDVIEERLWNGFYSEPKQYLRDIEIIYHDTMTLGDRERIVKASEMYANAQVAIDDICADAQFAQSCKEMHQREVERQKKALEQLKNNAVDLTGADEAGHTTGDEPNGETIVEPNGEVALAGAESATTELTNGVTFEISNTTEQELEDVEMKDASILLDDNAESVTVVETVVKHEHEVTIVVDEPEPAVTVTAAMPEKAEEIISEPEPATTIIPEKREPEPEPETPAEPEPPLVLDPVRLDAFENGLVQKCLEANLVVEQLEQINTCLVDTVWQNRGLWDRNVIIDKLEQRFDEVLQSILKGRQLALRDV